jgi:hypothetical protein
MEPNALFDKIYTNKWHEFMESKVRLNTNIKVADNILKENLNDYGYYSFNKILELSDLYRFPIEHRISLYDLIRESYCPCPWIIKTSGNQSLSVYCSNYLYTTYYDFFRFNKYIGTLVVDKSTRIVNIQTTSEYMLEEGKKEKTNFPDKLVQLSKSIFLESISETQLMFSHKFDLLLSGTIRYKSNYNVSNIRVLIFDKIPSSVVVTRVNYINNESIINKSHLYDEVKRVLWNIDDDIVITISLLLKYLRFKFCVRSNLYPHLTPEEYKFIKDDKLIGWVIHNVNVYTDRKKALLIMENNFERVISDFKKQLSLNHNSKLSERLYCYFLSLELF